MARVYAYDGVIPVVDSTAFVHPEAVLIGDVIVGAGCYIGPCAVLRGDFGRIDIGEGANIQETCVLHTFPNGDVKVEALGHIGHGAVLHGAHVGRNAMVGMNSVIMDGVIIGENTIVGAMTFMKAGLEFPPNALVVGNPAKFVRELRDDEITWKTEGTGVYNRLAAEAATKLQPAEPLSSPEPNRKRIRAPEYDPKYLRHTDI